MSLNQPRTGCESSMMIMIKIGIRTARCFFRDMVEIRHRTGYRYRLIRLKYNRYQGLFHYFMTRHAKHVTNFQICAYLISRRKGRHDNFCLAFLSSSASYDMLRMCNSTLMRKGTRAERETIHAKKT